MARRLVSLGMAVAVWLAVAPVGGAGGGPVDDPLVEARGCCSRHHGVCGCSDHVVVCCDKALSHRCTC